MDNLIEWYESHKTSARFMTESKEYKQIFLLTSFLDNHYEKITIAQRMWHIINNNYELQKCVMCNNFAVYKKQEKQYKVTCSKDCSKLYFLSEKYANIQSVNYKSSQDKIKKTCIERFGTDNYSKTDEFKTKYKETSLKLYGVDNYTKTAECKEKFNKICNTTDKKYYSVGEKEVLEYIKSIYQGEIIKNTRSIIYPYEIDIYLPEINLAIEYNGDFWHMNPEIYDKNDVCKGNGKIAKEIWERDIEKIEMCYNSNITLIVVWESDWNNKKDEIKESIKDCIYN